MKTNTIKMKNYTFSKKIDKTKKALLTTSQKIIILIISCFMLLFTFYKIGYIIFIIRQSISFSKLYPKILPQNTYSHNNDTVVIPENKEDKLNSSLSINESLLIPFSYAKTLEDVILNYIFSDVNIGFYIDIGIFDVDGSSATKYFYLKGWNGINIRPMGEEYNELINERPKDININYYSDKKMHSKFYFQNVNYTNVTFHKISDICEEYIPKKKIIHFCKINIKEDTRKIVLGHNFEKFRPKIFCIEDVNDNFESYEYVLNQNDYFFVYQYENTRYYFDSKISGLKEKFIYMDGVIKTYKKNISMKKLL